MGHIKNLRRRIRVFAGFRLHFKGRYGSTPYPVTGFGDTQINLAAFLPHNFVPL
jgi:hypothetical protein